jgi:hypothetical protein
MRYGDSKYDEPEFPPQLAAFQDQWTTFDRWIKDPEHAFCGVVTSVRGNKIQLRNAKSG